MSNKSSKSNWSTSTNSKANKFNLSTQVRTMLGLNSTRYLNSGKFGAVYNTDGGVIKVTSSKDIDGLTNEYNVSILAGENGIGPKIIKTKSGFVEHNGLYYLKLHMEKMDQTLLNYKKQNNINGTTIFKEIQQKVSLLHSLGYCHNDIHVKNIMTKNGNWYLIDFGKSTVNNTNYPCSSDTSKLGSLEYDLSRLVKSNNSNKPRRNLTAARALF